MLFLAQVWPEVCIISQPVCQLFANYNPYWCIDPLQLVIVRNLNGLPTNEYPDFQIDGSPLHSEPCVGLGRLNICHTAVSKEHLQSGCAIKIALTAVSALGDRTALLWRGLRVKTARNYRATRVCKTFLASDWFFSYARKFLSPRVGSELRASVTVPLLLIGSFPRA